MSTAIDVVRNMDLQLVGVAGKGGAGKDTVYDKILKPMGFLRLQMTLYRKLWIVSTEQATWEEVFFTKPPHVRKLLQEDITQVRYEYDEEIWVRTLFNQTRALSEIIGVSVRRIAVTDMRFLIEMRGLKAVGGKILHIESPDTNIPEEMRGHRSEVELDMPEMKELRDAHILNAKLGLEPLIDDVFHVLGQWEWV